VRSVLFAGALSDPVLVTRRGVAGRTRTVARSSGAPASLGVANGVVAVREGLQRYRAAVTERPHVGEPAVHLGAARLPTASLAYRCHDLSGELLDLEQLDGEIVEGAVALVHSPEQSLRAAKGLHRGRDDVRGAQRLDGPAVALIRRVEARRELASLRHRAKPPACQGVTVMHAHVSSLASCHATPDRRSTQ
jgi:hypothetical protein